MFFSGDSGLGCTWSRGEEGNVPHCSKWRQEETGPFMWQARAFSPERSVPRKPSRWAEAQAAALLPPHLGKLHRGPLCPLAAGQMPAAFWNDPTSLEWKTTTCHAHSDELALSSSSSLPWKKYRICKQVIRFEILPNLDSLSQFSPE